MSLVPSASSVTRLVAFEAKATKRPSDEIDGTPELPSPFAPAIPEPRLASTSVPACRSRTKTSETASASSGCRFVALELKATKRPPAASAAAVEPSLPVAPSAPPARLTSRRSSVAADAPPAAASSAASVAATRPSSFLLPSIGAAYIPVTAHPHIYGIPWYALQERDRSMQDDAPPRADFHQLTLRWSPSSAPIRWLVE